MSTDQTTVNQWRWLAASRYEHGPEKPAHYWPSASRVDGRENCLVCDEKPREDNQYLARCRASVTLSEPVLIRGPVTVGTWASFVTRRWSSMSRRASRKARAHDLASPVRLATDDDTQKFCAWLWGQAAVDVECWAESDENPCPYCDRYGNVKRVRVQCPACEGSAAVRCSAGHFEEQDGLLDCCDDDGDRPCPGGCDNGKQLVRSFRPATESENLADGGEPGELRIVGVLHG